MHYLRWTFSTTLCNAVATDVCDRRDALVAPLTTRLAEARIFSRKLAV
jgi:hypothetical protein